MIEVINRELLIPREEYNIGTCYDDNTETRHFHLKRVTSGGVDLAALTFNLDIQYANGNTDAASLVKEVTDKDINLVLTINNSMLQVPGTVLIQIRALDEDGVCKWTSYKSAFFVEDHINTPGHYEGDLTQLEQYEAEWGKVRDNVNQLNLRMDEVVRIREESPATEVEEEVIDARVGADNVVYGSLGTAIRKQFEDAYEAMEDNTEDWTAAVAAEATARANADTALQNNIDAEATARQTADNTLQGNINSEASTRATQDGLLQSQIDQIIAPSGEAPSAAEVQNARIGADGVTYDTLGNAIRGQVTDLKNHINELTENVISSGGMFPSSYFAQGGINSSGNYVQSTNYRVSTPETFTVKNDMIITVDNGFILTLWLYPSGGTAYNQDGSGFVIPKDTNARVMVRRVNENTSESANVNEFSSALFLTINDFDAKAISKLSYDIICERFEHITYADLLKNRPTLDKRASAGVFIDYDILFHENPYSIHMKTLSGDSVTSSEIRFTMPTAITLAGTQEFEMCVYIDDATNISNLSLRTMTGGFVKNNFPNIKTGWNKFRFFTEGAGTMTYDTDIVTFRLIVTHSVNTSANLYIGSLVQVKPEYANLIIIDDGPYYTFYTEAYPTLKQKGIPVNWAVDGGLLDDITETDRQLINEGELELLSMDGMSEFSFHSYDSTLMSSATAEQALADTLKCIRYLKKRGLTPEKIWRAAWLQNNCAHPELANLELDASCSYNGTSGVSFYPFVDRYNIGRISLQGRDTSYFTNLFTKMKNHHCTAFVYTHGIDNESERNMTPEMLAVFIDKVETGVNEGWLNATTYNRLVNYYKRIE